VRGIALLCAALAAFLVFGAQSVPDARASQSTCRDSRPQTGPRWDPCRRPASLIAAKVAASEIYDAYLRGKASLNDVRVADRRVSQFAKAPIPDPQPNFLARENGTDPSSEGGFNPDGFTVARQINDSYCGPATAASILWYFGRKDERFRTAAILDSHTNEHDVLIGADRDQDLLANDFWLATIAFDGTNWGERHMPFTLNAWRGDSFYSEHATPYLEGNLDKDRFIKAVRYDVDRGFPVAENARYNGSTYYPAGFLPGIDFQHWDTVYGYFDRDGTTYIQQGQVYGTPGLDYLPYQNIPLDTHWTALEQWHGIVW
jgi:hypothetical protein